MNFKTQYEKDKWANHHIEKLRRGILALNRCLDHSDPYQVELIEIAIRTLDKLESVVNADLAK